MNRQSISFTSSNDEWLKNQVEQDEYKSKSEVVNDLVRKARAKQAKAEFIREKLLLAEKQGYTNQSQEEILSEIKQDLVK